MALVLPDLMRPLTLHSATFFFSPYNMVFSLASNTQPGGTYPCSYVPQWQSGPVMPSDTGLPFNRLLQLTGLRWRHSNPLQRGKFMYIIWKKFDV